MARNNEKRKGKGKKIYAVLVDGETEMWYLQKMKQYESLTVDIKPDLHKKKKLKDQYQNVLDYLKDYDKVFWILDLDTLIREERETKIGEESKIQEFKGYVAKLKKYENIEVLVNTPCLEYWFLLHFKETSTYYSNYDSVVTALKKNEIFKDYKKTREYYFNSYNDIYKKLKPYQNKAIFNSKKLGSFDFANPESAKAEMYKVFDELRIK